MVHGDNSLATPHACIFVYHWDDGEGTPQDPIVERVPLFTRHPVPLPSTSGGNEDTAASASFPPSPFPFDSPATSSQQGKDHPAEGTGIRVDGGAERMPLTPSQLSLMQVSQAQLAGSVSSSFGQHYASMSSSLLTSEMRNYERRSSMGLTQQTIQVCCVLVESPCRRGQQKREAKTVLPPANYGCDTEVLISSWQRKRAARRTLVLVL